MKDAHPEKTRRARRSARVPLPPQANGLQSAVSDGQMPPSADRLLATATSTSEPALPGVAGLPLVQQPVLTPAEAARSLRARRRLSLLAGLVIVAVILAVEVVALSPWTDTPTAKTPRQVDPVPLAEVNPYGVNTFLHKEVDLWKKEQTLDMASQMGAGWIKQQFPWAEIEFAKDHFYDDKNNQSSWQKFDDIVDLAQQRGLRIIARIDSTPPWARVDEDDGKSV